MVTTKGWAAKGRVDRLVGEWSASGSSSSSSSGGGGSGGGSSSGIDERSRWLKGGGKRYYAHGGVEPRSLPGQLVPVRLGGARTGDALYPLVNFGPQEVLRINFRDVHDQEAEWQSAMRLSLALKIPKPTKKANLGDTVGDYGGSHESLNFAQSDEARRAGKLSYGSLQKDAVAGTDLASRRAGENGHRELVNGLQQDAELLAWFLHLLRSLASFPVELFYPVAVLLFGARTLRHLDSFYGGQPNVARIFTPGGSLAVDYSIPFRQCVVRYGLDMFVPMGLYHKKGMVLKLLQLLPDGRGRYTTAYPLEWLQSEEVSIVGYLPYLVLQCNSTNTVLAADGSKVKLATDHMVGVVPVYDCAHPVYSLVYEPAQATYLASTQLIADAVRCPERPQSVHPEGVMLYNSSHGWFAFNGWQFPHWWVGDPWILRVNLYSRPMRQVPAGSNVSDTDSVANDIRWKLTGHDFVGKTLVVRGECLPEQVIEAESEGAVGTVVKWAPNVELVEKGEVALFRLHVPGADPFGNLGGEDGSGLDLEEYEVLALIEAECGGVHCRTRSHLAKRPKSD
jgi:hypothetical protein